MSDFLSPTAWALLFLVISAAVLIGLMVLHRRRRFVHSIRDIPPITDLESQLKRAAESGKPLHIALGSGQLAGTNTVSSLAAVQLLEGIVDAAVSYDVPPIVTVGDPTLVPLAQDALRRAYDRNRIAELYDPTRVRFVAPSPLAYGACAIPVGAPEVTSATIVVGTFGSEASLLVDFSDQKRTPKTAILDAVQGIGALYPSTDRIALGEELFAVGAQLTDEKRFAISLLAEDILRGLLVVVIVLGALAALIGG